MFKISKLKSNPASDLIPKRSEEQNSALNSFCVAEDWSADLYSGLFDLGPRTIELHGLEQRESYGLLSIVRMYDQSDHNQILELFEMAASMEAKFCFATVVRKSISGNQPIFCVAQSVGDENDDVRRINGVFMFPKFTVNTPQT